MNNQVNIIRKRGEKLHTALIDEYAYFLEIHSLDLKYMVPWSQYEDHKVKENQFQNYSEMNNKDARSEKKKPFHLLRVENVERRKDLKHNDDE